VFRFRRLGHRHDTNADLLCAVDLVDDEMWMWLGPLTAQTPTITGAVYMCATIMDLLIETAV
jgi:hypothetical protein